VFAAVKAGDILEVIVASLAAGVFVSVSFSLVVLGSARSADSRRTGAGTAALAWGGLAVLAFVTFAAAVVYGVHIMLSKG
jgi:hypothetical protein